jgi:integrase
MAKGTMPKPADGVYSRTDSKKWQWRIKVPADLRSEYGNKQWAHGCSLKTSEVREANRRAALLRAEWLNRFEQQRQQAHPSKVDRITPEMIQALADWSKHAVLNVDEGVRTNPRAWSPFPSRKTLLGGMPEHLVDTLRETNEEQLALMAEAVARSRLGQAERIMKDAAVDLGLALDDEAEGFDDALRACLFALKDAYALCVQRDQGVRVDTPPPPSLKAQEMQRPRLRNVFNRWKEAKDDASDNVKKKAAALKLYEEQTGDPPLQELTRDQGEAFKTYLLKQKGASKTKHDRLDAVKTLLNYGRRDLRWIPDNPWEGLDIPYRTEKKRRPWTEPQVTVFFGLPIFTQYNLPKPTFRNGGAAAYWIPLLGLYTGARIGELCQLRVRDVIVSEGIPVLSINEEAEGAKVKSEAGIREVPIHSELLRLGFLQYVDSLRTAGEDRLWPALKFRKGKPGGYFSSWFGETRRALAEGVPDFHSLRHTVRSKMANTSPPHSSGGAGSHYGARSVRKHGSAGLCPLVRRLAAGRNRSDQVRTEVAEGVPSASSTISQNRATRQSRSRGSCHRLNPKSAATANAPLGITKGWGCSCWQLLEIANGPAVASQHRTPYPLSIRGSMRLESAFLRVPDGGLPPNAVACPCRTIC